MSGDGNGHRAKVYIHTIGMIATVMLLWAWWISTNQFVENLILIALTVLVSVLVCVRWFGGGDVRVSAEDQEAAESSSSQHDSDEYAKSISEQNDDNSESDDSILGCLYSVVEFCQAVFYVGFAVFMVVMLIYLLIDTAMMN